MDRITSRANPLLSHIRRLSSDAAYRRQSGQFVGDSPKLLREALQWGVEPVCVVCTEGAALPTLPEGVRAVCVPGDVMASVSPMKSPQGVLFTGRIPALTPPEKLTGRRYVALEGVQDPGNVGAVLRTLDAFDGDGLFLLPGCADPYSPKTLRSSMGALFRRPVWSCSASELCRLLQRSGLPLYGAALRHTGRPHRGPDPGRRGHRQRGPGPVSGAAGPLRRHRPHPHVPALRVSQCRRSRLRPFVGGLPGQ